MKKQSNPHLMHLEDLLIQAQLSARNEAHSQTASDFDSSYQSRCTAEATSKTEKILQAAELSCDMAMRTGVISEKSSQALMRVFKDAVENARESQEILSPWDEENAFRQALLKSWSSGWRKVVEVWS